MAQYNFSIFRELLHKAIGNRTQAQFAHESGLSAEHLNRMLNSSNIHRPTDRTLRKMASVAENGVTLQRFQDALNKQDPAYRPDAPNYNKKLEEAKEDFKLSFREAAQQTMESLALIMCEYPVFTHDINDHINKLVTAASEHRDGNLELFYEMDISRPYFGKQHTYAANYICVHLSMFERNETATSGMLVYYTEVPSPSETPFYVIQNVSLKVHDISELFGYPPAALMEYNDDLVEADKAPFYMHISPVEHFCEIYEDTSGATAEERLLHNIFGVTSRHSETLTGLGFWLDDTPPDGFLEMVKSHRALLLAPYEDDQEEYEGILAKLNELCDNGDNQALADYLDEINYVSDTQDCGWGAAIACIMREETGFPYGFYAKPDDPDEFPGLSDSGCILLPEAAEKEINRQTALTTTAFYLDKLGLPTFGDLLFTHVVRITRKPHIYMLSDKKKSYDINDHIEHLQYGLTIDQPPSCGTGLYAVKLKDGRYMKCMYIKSNNAWVMFHREFSSLIESYCPLPLKDCECETDETEQND